jgi:hypothetical protein
MGTRLFTFFFFLFAFQKADAQQIYFYFNDASVQVYNISELSRIDFEGDLMNLRLNDASVVSFNTDLLNYYRYFAEGVTSASDLPSRPDFKVYPNPVDNNLNVRLELLKPAQIELSVRNLQGMEVLNKRTQAQNEDELNFDLGHLASGQYICVINTGEYVITKTFIKR